MHPSSNKESPGADSRRASASDRRKSLDVRLVQPQVIGSIAPTPPLRPAQSLHTKRENGGRNSLLATPPESNADIQKLRQSETSDMNMNRGSIIKSSHLAEVIATSKNTIKGRTPPDQSRQVLRTSSFAMSDKFYKTQSLSHSGTSFKGMTDDMERSKSERVNAFTLSFVEPLYEGEYEKFYMAKTLSLWRFNLCVITTVLLCYYAYFFATGVQSEAVSTLDLSNKTCTWNFCSSCHPDTVCDTYNLPKDIIFLVVGVLFPFLVAFASSLLLKPALLIRLFHGISSFYFLTTSTVGIYLRFYVVQPNINVGNVSTLQIFLVTACITMLRLRFSYAAISGIISVFVFYGMFGHLSTSTVMELATVGSPMSFTSVTKNFVILFLVTLVIIYCSRETETFTRYQFVYGLEMHKMNSKLTSQLKGLQKTFNNKAADFDSPLEKSVLILKSILADPGVSPAILVMLDQVVQLLGSTNILTPDLENQLTDFMDNEQEAWLFSEIAPRKRVGGALRKAGPGNRRRSSVATGPSVKKETSGGEKDKLPSVEVDLGGTAAASSGPILISASSLSNSPKPTSTPRITHEHQPAESTLSPPNIIATKNSQRQQNSRVIRSSSNRTREAGPTMSFDQFNEIVTSPVMAPIIASVDVYNWKIFEFVDASDSHPLCVLTGYLFERADLFSHFDIPYEKFWKFVATIELAYHSDLPFHNAAHAADVLHCIAHLAQLDKISNIIGETELLCIYIAAIVHDVDHPGVNNNFLSTTYDVRAILYNDKSILENHHLATAFSLMSRTELDFLGQLPRAEFKQIRETVIEMVLATDLSQHFGLLASFKNKIAQTFDPKECREDRVILLKILMKCADVSNPTKEWPIYFPWCERVQEEFMRQGDLEKSLNLPVSPFMDRENINVPSSQIGFMDYVLLPLFEAVNKYIEVPHILGSLQANREHWVKLRTCGVVHLAHVISPAEMEKREAAAREAAAAVPGLSTGGIKSSVTSLRQ
ncbi:cAMP-specific 3',5'-cyclic phosphodiesterase 4D [Chytriomyces hyalinus]|nr:cAMP-specific 3',5'-cyclic phosphodiesterase 4D [Chytriomyces hyalinus]